MTSTTKDRDDLADAMEQCELHYDSIKRLVAALKHFEDDDAGPIDVDGDAMESRDDVETRIGESPLSVQVRSGWYTPGDNEGAKPEEYEILLCTGGPAVRIVGDLGAHGEPSSARIEGQDWGTPWTRWRGPTSKTDPNALAEDIEPVLLDYARRFYFG